MFEGNALPDLFNAANITYMGSKLPKAWSFHLFNAANITYLGYKLPNVCPFI